MWRNNVFDNGYDSTNDSVRETGTILYWVSYTACTTSTNRINLCDYIFHKLSKYAELILYTEINRLHDIQEE